MRFRLICRTWKTEPYWRRYDHRKAKFWSCLAMVQRVYPTTASTHCHPGMASCRHISMLLSRALHLCAHTCLLIANNAEVLVLVSASFERGLIGLALRGATSAHAQTNYSRGFEGPQQRLYVQFRARVGMGLCKTRAVRRVMCAFD